MSDTFPTFQQTAPAEPAPPESKTRRKRGPNKPKVAVPPPAERKPRQARKVGKHPALAAPYGEVAAALTAEPNYGKVGYIVKLIAQLSEADLALLDKLLP